MKIEGLILNKVPFKERDLICTLLLRSGKKLSVLFPGGMGGGKKKKSHNLEVGNLFSVELMGTFNREKKIYKAKEWQLKWFHERMRNSYMAVCLLAFFVDFCKQSSVEASLEVESDLAGEGEFVGFFKVLSNALVLLESIQERLWEQAFIFLAKLSLELGVFPEEGMIRSEVLIKLFQVVEKPYREALVDLEISKSDINQLLQFLNANLGMSFSLPSI